MQKAKFGKGQLEDVGKKGWVVAHFIDDDLRKTGNVEVKWAREKQGIVSAEWRGCKTATTLSVLVSGKFQIEFRGDHAETVVFENPGEYVIFGPGIEHRSTALLESVFLTIRWPSIEGDCQPIKENL